MTITELIEKLQSIPNPDTTIVHYQDDYRSREVTEIELEPDNTDTEEFCRNKLLPKEFIVIS